MISGKLDRRIRIQYATTATNTMGERVQTWNLFADVWASIEYTDTKEGYEAAELVAPNEVTFKMRYIQISEAMRIVYNEQIYDIKHIAVINRNEGLKVIALKKDNVMPYIIVPSTSTATIDVSVLEYVLAISETETTVPGADFTPPITVEPRIIQATVNGSLIDQVVRYEQNGSNYDIVLAPTDEELTLRICVL